MLGKSGMPSSRFSYYCAAHTYVTSKVDKYIQVFDEQNMRKTIIKLVNTEILRGKLVGIITGSFLTLALIDFSKRVRGHPSEGMEPPSDPNAGVRSKIWHI